MQLNTVTLSEFTDRVEKKWVQDLALIPERAKQLFIITDEAANTGDTRRYDEIDGETYALRMEEGSDAAIAAVKKGYNVVMTAQRVAREISITWQMRRYNKYPEVVARLTSLTHFCPQRMDIDLTHRLTFASATSYTNMDGETVATTVGDGYAVLYATHTLTGTSSTYNNIVTGAPRFSTAGLEAAEEIANTQILSNFGEKRSLDFNTIVTSNDPNTVNRVKRFLQSTADVDGANPGVINVYKGKYRHIVLPNLATTAVGAYDSTKAKYWFLVAANGTALGWQAYCGIWEAPHLKTPTPTEGNNGEDVHNDNWYYGCRASYGVAIVSGRGIIGSLAT